MARYRKLDLRTWNDKKFRALTPLPPSGQSLWLYLILGPQTTNIPGLFEASEVALADRLGWSLEAFREAFREASAKGMAKADWTSRLVWLPRAPDYNKPESPNVVKSWGATFDELPECALKWEAYQSLKAFVKGMKKAFQEAFDQAFPKPLPNQEQEQEQEQKQDTQSGRANVKPAEMHLNPVEEHERFERVMSAYPKFVGAPQLLLVEKACRDRVAEGATWDELEAAAKRFAEFVRLGGRSNPRYVDSPLKFFGSAKWRDDWTPPPTKDEARVADNIDETQAFLDEMRGAGSA